MSNTRDIYKIKKIQSIPSTQNLVIKGWDFRKTKKKKTLILSREWNSNYHKIQCNILSFTFFSLLSAFTIAMLLGAIITSNPMHKDTMILSSNILCPWFNKKKFLCGEQGLKLQ